MTAVYAVTFALLGLAAVLTTVRLVRGPGVLDRIVSLDVLVTLLAAGIAVGIAVRSDGSGVPVLLAVALLAFVGSVTAAHLVERREGMR
ncbi:MULTISPECIES: monovalent cation/H+ antiporter complex subunit F [Streptomyces]|uniref:monovalent cation/H+ antiporter complex subunit F n=1 Tax=Streptomyces TaxID=1883 RepID=UPI0022494484|nr:monovalent cation/H+ antiporter complex subunit F [Streptomyces sp. JHD 1]MCX2968255.1 monovalent cation/H+ antiporter complex subunit F [Streptomyces sp. JHD 1]